MSEQVTHSKIKKVPSKLEHVVESFIFRSRWLLAPFFIGLLVAVVLLLLKFFKYLYSMALNTFTASNQELLVGILTLVDTALLAGLLLIIIFSGYESFVSKIDIDTHEDKPGWMGKVGFGALKVKVIGSIMAISAIELLKVFVNSGEYVVEEIQWKVMIHLTFVLSGVLFAVMDWLGNKK